MDLRREVDVVGELEVVRRQRLLVADRDREMEFVAELAQFMGYCCAEKGNKETTIAGKLVAIICYYEQFVGLSMPLGNRLIRSVKQGIKRAHVEKGTQQRVKRPLAWGMLTRMQ